MDPRNNWVRWWSWAGGLVAHRGLVDKGPVLTNRGARRCSRVKMLRHHKIRRQHNNQPILLCFPNNPAISFLCDYLKRGRSTGKDLKKMRMTLPGEDGKLASAATAAFVPQHHQQPRKLTLSKDYTFLLCPSRPKHSPLNHDLVAGPVPVQRQSMERSLPKLASSPLPPVLLHPVPNLPSQPLQRRGDQQQQLLLHRTHGRRSAC